MLKNSSALAVYVPINISIELGFVSVNGHRETCFVDALRIVIFKIVHKFIKLRWVINTLLTVSSYSVVFTN